jgi:hypothetical protein
LHIDSYDPHEPWDPPEELVKMFDPTGYNVEGWSSHPPYAPWRGRMTKEQFTSFRARYAAEVLLMDRWLGVLFDKKVDEMRRALGQKLFECSAPNELLERFQLSDA